MGTVLASMTAAADPGDADAQFDLGNALVNGDGVAQNYAEAARLFRMAAAQGHAGAQCNLANMHAAGVGVPHDFAEAARLYWLAAAQGFGGARPALAKLSGERGFVAVCCAGCGATRKLKTCARCQVARFCGPECVRTAWAEHKPHCERWRPAA